MTVLALTDEETTMWVIALGIGLVVVIVVIALLSLLLKIVKDIDTNVAILWATAQRMAANTAQTWQLAPLADTADRLREEALRHDQLLGQS